MPLLLPDAPIVAWWPGTAPENPAQDPIGVLAQRRITDAAMASKPAKALEQRARTHAPGRHRPGLEPDHPVAGLLAAALDQPPYEPVRSATVTSGADSPSGDLLAAWLALYLQCPVRRVRTRVGERPDRDSPGPGLRAGRPGQT